jgi:hypothetical protein
MLAIATTPPIAYVMVAPAMSLGDMAGASMHLGVVLTVKK